MTRAWFLAGWQLLWLLLSLSIQAAEGPASKDSFGVVELFPTAPQGREWFARWNVNRTVGAYADDPQDAACRNEDGAVNIENGVAIFKPGMTRWDVSTLKDKAGHYTQSQWRNVEMTVYFKRGPSSRELDYQAFYLSCRSGEKHDESVPCEGTSYHATVRFDGQCGFKKEIWHTGGYTKLAPEKTPRPWKTVPMDRWTGMKFVCRNCDNDTHVKLQLYLDTEEKNDWHLVADYTDTGGWKGEKAGCNRPQDYIITEARPMVYFRTDYVNVALKKFSVREIAPLP